MWAVGTPQLKPTCGEGAWPDVHHSQAAHHLPLARHLQAGRQQGSQQHIVPLAEEQLCHLPPQAAMSVPPSQPTPVPDPTRAATPPNSGRLTKGAPA